MMRSLFILCLIGLAFNGCIIADDIFLPPEPQKEASLQDRCQDTVELYLAKQAKEFIYKPYGFSDITVVKPIQIIELEKLQKEQKENPEKDLDSTIRAKKEFIKKNNISRTIKVDHFYTLKDSVGNITVVEEQFVLSDTLHVKDSKLLILLDIPQNYEDVLIYYFYEYTIFLSYSYESSRKLSLEFYSFFKTHLDELNTIAERSEFLWHTLQLCKGIKETGAFHQQYVLEEMVKDYITNERSDIKEYEPLQFSELYQNTDESADNVINYYFFHKFIGLYGTVLDTNVIMVEFTPYYELGPIYQMDRPYHNYFK